MSKTLLSESEIKDFMKYANLGKDTASNFIERLNEHSLAEQEEPAEEEPEEGPEGAEGAEEAPEEAPEEVPGMEAGAEEAPGAGGEDEAMESAVEQVVGAIVKALGEVPGAPEISMEGGEEMEAGAPEMDEVPGAEEMDAAAPEAGAPEAEEEPAEMAMERLMEAIEEAEMYLEDAMGMDELEEDMYEGEMDEDLYEGEMEDDYAAFGETEGAMPMDEVVNEVTRRVAARILKSRKSNKRR